VLPYFEVVCSRQRRVQISSVEFQLFLDGNLRYDIPAELDDSIERGFRQAFDVAVGAVLH